MTDQTLSTQEHPMSIAERAADNIRALAISMVERAKSGLSLIHIFHGDEK